MTINTTQHTPTLYPQPDDMWGVMIDASNSQPFDGSDRDWAAFVLACKQRDEACKTHAALLAENKRLREALKFLLGHCDPTDRRHLIPSEVAIAARAALAETQP